MPVYLTAEERIMPELFHSLVYLHGLPPPAHPLEETPCGHFAPDDLQAVPKQPVVGKIEIFLLLRQIHIIPVVDYKCRLEEMEIAGKQITHPARKPARVASDNTAY